MSDEQQTERTIYGHSHAAPHFVPSYKPRNHPRNPQDTLPPPYLLTYNRGKIPATHETRRQRFGVLSAGADIGKDAA